MRVKEKYSSSGPEEISTARLIELSAKTSDNHIWHLAYRVEQLTSIIAKLVDKEHLTPEEKLAFIEASALFEPSYKD